MPTPDLVETLRDAQRLGFFGPGPVEPAIDHAAAFADAIGDVEFGTTIIDLGSGGGLPGLVLADEYPQASIVLVDRRQKRTDFLRRAVSRLGFDHVEVVAGDVDEVASAVESGARRAFDVVTARGFGPPSVTLTFARRLLTPNGRIVISEPPREAGDRWDDDLLARLALTSVRLGPVRVFSPR